MSLDDVWNIVDTIAADFSIIVAENFVKFVAFWKMFC